jgi:hypothetical protein
MNPLLLLTLLRSNWKIIATVGALLGAFGGGWAVHGWKYASDNAAAIEAAAAEASKQATALEAELGTLRETNRKLSKKAAYETRKDSYRCALPDDGLRLLNAARTGAPGESDR